MFVVVKIDLLNGQRTVFKPFSLEGAKVFVKFREALNHQYGSVYRYIIKLKGYEC